MENYRDELKAIRAFLPYAEYKTLESQIKPDQEESDGIGAIIHEAKTRIDTMPKTYEQEELGDNAIVYLHYFIAACDWYITEKDMSGDGTQQAFGFAILNNDLENAEYGYIPIDEITALGAELDLYWRLRTVAQVKRDKGL